MSNLTAIEREAKLAREFITELKGLTPRFNATKERAEEELRLHLAKIDGERAKLAELIDAAALIVQHLGADVPVETMHTEAETAAVMAEDAPEQVTDETEIAVDELGHDFETIGAIAAEITAAVEFMAGGVPEHIDATDEPEMTDTQVERAEERLAAEPVRELEMAGAGAGPRRFNPFAGNPFA